MKKYYRIQFLLFALLVPLLVPAVVVTEDFDSPDWKAVADPAAGTAINVTDLVRGNPNNPNRWVMKSGNSFPDDFFIGNSATLNNAPLSFLTGSASMGLKNFSLMAFPLTNLVPDSQVQVEFDYEIIAANGNLHWGIWNGEPVISGTSLNFSDAIAYTTRALSGSDTTGSINETITATAPTQPVYVVFYKDNYGSPVHIDHIRITYDSEGIIAYNGSAVCPEDGSVDITLHAVDAEGRALTYSIATAPTNGNVTVAGNTATYTVNAGVTAGDQFTFVASHNGTNSNEGVIDVSIDVILPFQDHTLPLEQRLDDLVSRLTLAEKIALFTNGDGVVQRFGIETQIPGECLHGLASPRNNPATNLPQSMGMAASWNPMLMKQCGAMVGDEARAQYHNGPVIRDGVRGPLMFWSPVVNMSRDPRWGRTQEGYGEDPHLVAEMVTAYVSGLQGDDPNYIKTAVGAKHFVANNEEATRYGGNAEISEKQLREYFFPGYKAAVQRANAQMIMTAYNAVNGIPCVVNGWLVNDVLRNEWGFDGLVISDYGSAPMLVNGWSKGSFTGQNYVPDSDTATEMILDQYTVTLQTDNFLKGNAQRLLDQGRITMEQIDRNLKDVLRVRFKLGQFDPPELQPWKDLPFSIVGCQAHADLAHEMGVQSAVLLKNEPVNGQKLLPIDESAVTKVAIIGPNAAVINRGTYSGNPKISRTQKDAITDLLGASRVEWVPWVGDAGNSGSFEGNDIPLDDITLLDGNGIPVWKMEFYDNLNFSGSPYEVRYGYPYHVDWGAADAFPAGLNPERFCVRYSTTVTVQESGTYQFDASAIGSEFGGAIEIQVDDTVIARHWHKYNKTVSHPAELTAGQVHTIELRYGQVSPPTGCTLRFGWRTPSDLLAEQGGFEAEAAGRADLVIAFMGLDTEYEREEVDRTVEGLPQLQLQVLEDVLAVNSNLVVVLHNGSSIESPEVVELAPALMTHWYPGQSGGTAITDLLFGMENPGGKLPLTWVKDWDDLPPMDDFDLTKGRTYLYMDKEPLFPFGFGLSYTTFEYSGLSMVSNQVPIDGTIGLSVAVTNTGPFDGDEVVQLYVRDISNAAANKPRQRLKAFKRVSIPAGSVQTVQLSVTVDELNYWNSQTKEYEVQTGMVELRVGSSSADIRSAGLLTIYSAADADGDAMPDAWEITHGLNVSMDDGALDKDGDGVSNLWEYRGGTDPGNPASAFAVHGVPETGLTNIVIQWNAATNFQYSVLRSTNLVEGFQTLESGIVFPQNSYTDRIHQVEPSAFYKVKGELSE